MFLSRALFRSALLCYGLWPALGFGQSANCLQSTSYFAGFYLDLYTMHRHGIDTFATDTAERQMYFFQVQRSGDKLEANIVKSVRDDNTLSASEKKQRIQLHHAVGQRVREMAATDAQNTQPIDKASVLLALQEACL
jgi:hypothetical protein